MPLAGHGLASPAVNKEIKPPQPLPQSLCWDSCGAGGAACSDSALGAAFAFTFPSLLLEEAADRDRHDFLGTAHSDFYYDITRTYVCGKKIYMHISPCLASE